jgi:uncharacterized membrane protein
MMSTERRSNTFETAKILGLIGALFMVVSVFGSSAGNALGLVGLVLLLFSFHELADYYGDRSIFKNVLNGIIIFLVGVVVASVIIGVAAAGALSQIGISMSSWSDPTAWQGIDWNNLNYNTLAPYIAAMGVALIIVFVLTVVAAYFIRKSFKTMALRSGVAMFDTSGLLLFVGAILTIIFVGFILLWVAMILLTIAFFRLRAEVPVQPVQPAVSPGP